MISRKLSGALQVMAAAMIAAAIALAQPGCGMDYTGSSRKTVAECRPAVLIVYESGELNKLSRDQVVLLNSTTFREFLKRTCEKDGAGRAMYLFADKDLLVEGGTSQKWAISVATKNKRQSNFWMYAVCGSRVLSVALPKSVEDAEAAIDKFSGKGK